MELDDFFYKYPDKNEPDFQAQISSLHEFNQLALPREGVLKPNPVTGNFNHQELMNRFMFNYDRSILMWEAGLGKTWGSLGPIEQFRKMAQEYEQGLFGNYTDLYFTPVHTYIKKAYIVLKNKNLIKTFKKELYSKNLKPGETLNEDTIRKYRKETKKFYTFVTYRGFYNIIKNKTDTQLKEMFEHAYIVIDEVHNMKPVGKAVPKGKDEPTSDDEKPTEGKKKGVTYKDVYYKFLYLFELLETTKIMLLSATLMFNNVSEIAYPINLILPKGKKMPTQPSKYIQRQDPKKPPLPLDIKLLIPPDRLREYFQGIISYVRSANVGIDIKLSGDNVYYPYNGPIADNNYLQQALIKNVNYFNGEETVTTNVLRTSQIVEKCYMVDGGFQQEAALNDLEMSVNKKNREIVTVGEEQEETKESTALYTPIKKISNFVFPNGSPNPSPDYIVKKRSDRYDFKPSFIQKYLGEGKNYRLNELSCKFDRIVEIVRKKRETKQKGIIYIFFELKESGAYLLDAVLRAVFGYERLGGREVLPKTPPKIPKIALVSGDVSNIQDILDSVNQDANYKGEYIEIVIATSAASEGFSIKNVTTIIQAESTWNEARSYQAIKRGIRINSFEKLIYEQAKDEGLQMNGLTLEEIAARIKNKIRVNVYKMAALLYPMVDVNDNEVTLDSSFDTNRYFGTEKKDWYIKTMERFMKEAAVDCQIHKKRNIDPEGKNYTPDCDYQLCDYKCNYEATSVSNYTTYNILYSQENIEQVKTILKYEMQRNIVVTVDKIVGLVEKKLRLPVDTILMVISKIVDRNETFLDRFGYPKYLYEDGGFLYLSEEYGVQGMENYNNIAYGSFFVIKQTNNISTLVDKEVKQNTIEKIKTTDYAGVVEAFKGMSIDEKSSLLEKVIIDYIKKTPGTEEINDFVLNEMNGHWFNLPEPIGMIIEARKFMDRNTSGVKTMFHELKDEKWEEIKQMKGLEVGEKIIIHYVKMYNLSPTSRKSGVERFSGKVDKKSELPPVSNIRILKVENDVYKWRTVSTIYDNNVYARILDDNITKTYEDFKQKHLGHFTEDSYVEKKGKSKLDPIFVLKNTLEPKKENVFQFFLPMWWNQKHDPRSIKLKPGDKRPTPKGSATLTTVNANLLSEYLSERTKVATNSTHKKMLIKHMAKLGLLLDWQRAEYAINKDDFFER